jgi:hypothetical protein
MSSNNIVTGTTVFNPFSTLQSLSQATATMTQNLQMANIAQDLQNQLNRQLAAIQPTTDQVSIDISQNRINGLQSQQKTISGLETRFGNNGSILTDMTSQLNLMTQAISKGDNTAFDNALSALNTNYTILTPPAWNPIFQNDGVLQFKMAGAINIQSSATYDLSTQAGQDSATADITNVQNLLQGFIKVNGANQTVAASQLTALNGQISSLQNIQYQQQTASQQAVQQQTNMLTQNMQNNLHLIQLSLGNSSQLATALSAALNPPQAINSVFGALTNSIGQTAAGVEKQLGQMPAVMSLFA